VVKEAFDQKELPDVELARKVSKLMTDALGPVGEERAELTIRKDPNAPTGGYILALVPKNENAAKVVAYAANDADVVEVVLGHDLNFEVPVEGRWRPTGLSSFDDEIHALCSAAIKGHVREGLWLNSTGEVVRSSGAVVIGSKTLRPASFHVGRGLLRATRKIELRYEPYC
jgi:hypothetical protein